MPSIHPQHSASSTDSDQVKLGLPGFFLWYSSQSSVFSRVVRLEPPAERGRRREETDAGGRHARADAPR